MRLLPAILLVACAGSPVGGGGPPPDLGTDETPCTDPVPWHVDRDRDGYGDRDTVIEACEQPFGYLADGRDCDDRDAGTFPGAIEVCDGVDRDCNGIVDEGAVDAPTWYRDGDGDGHAGSIPVGRACTPVEDGARTTPDDCDDADPTRHPGAPDPPCDGVDQDCGGRLRVEAAFIDGVPYPTAQDAFDALGDVGTVDVCEGTHRVRLFRTADPVALTVQGHPGDRPVVLQAWPGARVLDVAGPRLALRDLRLVGHGKRPVDGDGGLVRADVDRLVLRDVRLQDGRATGDGGAVHATVGSDGATLVGVDLIRTRADGDGGGLALVQDRASRVTVDGGLHLQVDAGGRGGAIAVGGRTSTVRLDATGIRAADVHAGTEGGWLSVIGRDHAVIRLDDIAVDAAAAARLGGALSVRAPDEVKLSLTGLALSDGEALTGGLVAVSAASALDLSLSDTTLSRGSALQGGLLWVEAGRVATLDLAGGALQDGAAPAGAGLWLTGTLDAVSARLDEVVVEGHVGGAALAVDPVRATAGGAGLGLRQDGGRLGGAQGGIAAPVNAVVILDDVAVGETGPFTVRTGEVPVRLDGPARVRCVAGACAPLD